MRITENHPKIRAVVGMLYGCACLWPACSPVVAAVEQQVQQGPNPRQQMQEEVQQVLEQAGEILGVSRRSAYRRWESARAWLFREMRPR